MIEAKCMACGETFAAPDDLNGSRKNCPACGKPVMIHAKKLADGPAAASGRMVQGEVAPPLKRYLVPVVRLRTMRSRRVYLASRIVGCVAAAVWLALSLLWPRPFGEPFGSWPIVFLLAILTIDLLTERSGGRIPLVFAVVYCIGLYMLFIWPMKPLLRNEPAREVEEPAAVSTPAQPGAWDGFRDLKWGTLADDVAGLELAYEVGQRAVYTRPDDRLAAAEGRLDIMYVFQRGALREVLLSCRDRQSVDRLRKEIIARYGRNAADVAPTAAARYQFWTSAGHTSDGEARLTAAFPSSSRGTVTITYMPLAGIYGGDGQPAASDSRPTTRGHR